MLLPSFLWTLLKKLGEGSFKGSKRGNWSRRYVPANKTKTAFEAVFVLFVESTVEDIRTIFEEEGRYVYIPDLGKCSHAIESETFKIQKPYLASKVG